MSSEKIFRIKVKKEDLTKLIHGLALYYKSRNFETLGRSDYLKRQHLVYLQRLVRTYQGKTGRPDEWGFWSMHRLSKEAFDLKIDTLIENIPDPLEAA